MTIGHPLFLGSLEIGEAGSGHGLMTIGHPLQENMVIVRNTASPKY